jgi:hypothetical protein
VRLELRFVYTIDEFPFRGRELPVPTYATVAAQEIDLRGLAACGATGGAGLRASRDARGIP